MRSKRQSNPANSLLELRPSYRGQPVASFKLMRDAFVYTTNASGVITSSTDISTASINGFATKFQMWQEYRVVKVTFHYQPFSSTNPGTIRMWVEEKNSAVPSLADANTNRGITVANSDVMSKNLLVWKPTDVGDMEFTAIGSTLTLGYLNLYTSNAQFGSPASTVVGSLIMTLTVQFRGFTD